MTINDNIQCTRKGCDEWFFKRTHNQRYCSAECCRVATNQRIMEKYYATRDQKAGKARYCKKCKVTKLSRYNNYLICGACKSAVASAANGAVIDMLSNMSWIV